MKNKIEDLRDHLFETLEALKDENHPMELDRAKAVAEVAQVIVNSAKVECDYIKIAGGKGSGFIPLAAPPITQAETPPVPCQPRLVRGRDTRD